MREEKDAPPQAPRQASAPASCQSQSEGRTMTATKTNATASSGHLRRAPRLALLVLSVLAALAAGAGPASALAAPALHIASSHYPPSVPAGSYAKYTLAVSNPGDAPTSEEEEATVKFTVPAGFE